MIVYFAGRNLDILGMAATGLPDGLRIVDDLKTEDIDSGVASLELTVCFPGQNPQVMEQMCDVGNYLLCSCQGENEFYTVIDYERDSKEQTIRLYAEDAGLDLLNEIAPPFAADAAHDIGWYVDTFAKDSGFELGINEIPTLTRKLAWEGEQTVTERLRSVATQFDNCELSYSFAAKGMEITHKYINIYARRGKDMEETLRLNLELDRIVTKKSAANLATALLVTGGIPEGAEDPVTLEGYEYDDGDLYTDGAHLKSRSAVEKWGRYIQDESGGASDRHIVQTYTYDTTSQQTLCAHAVTELKQRSEAEVNYEVDIRVLPENVRIGDRINIVDDNAALYLSARILKLERSACLDKRTATLGEYLIRDSGISERVYELAQSYKKAVQGASVAQFTANTAKEEAANAREAVDAAQVQIDALSADFAAVKELVADKADIVDLEAVNATITNLEAQNANLENLVAEKADITDLEAANAHLEDLSADLAQVEELVAGKANITDLEAANAQIGSLTADLANVETLLAGSAGVGNLQAIHLTGDNVVIDDALITDAMIANLSAGKLTAGTLYTSLVKIASDQEEHLVIDGATLQLKDAAGTVRVQIGKDASGDYSYYLWDAQGNLMWSPAGVTADGLNDGIIRDINVAEDAAISGDKLNISSVAQKLNEDGSLTVDAGQVTIDGTKLDVAYQTVTNQVEEMGSRTTALETEVEVVQGQIASKVWQSDITQITDPLGQQVTTLEDQYSQMEQTVEGITLSVGSLQTTVSDQGSSISDVQGQLALKVGKDENDQIVSMLNASADLIQLSGQRIQIDSPNFKLAADGTIAATGANLSGKITAASGNIAGWGISPDRFWCSKIYNGVEYQYVLQAPSETAQYDDVLYCRHRALGASAWEIDFQLQTSGYINANRLSIQGNAVIDKNVTVGGSLSTYGYKVPRMQHGSVTVTSVSPNTVKDFSVTFPKAFPGVPSVTLTPRHSTGVTIDCKLRSISSTGFTGDLYHNGTGTAGIVVYWIAMYG